MTQADNLFYLNEAAVVAFFQQAITFLAALIYAFLACMCAREEFREDEATEADIQTTNIDTTVVK